MDVDQHVRCALVLQTGLGVALAARYGYVPGANATVFGVAIAVLLWLGYVELVHRLRHRFLTGCAGNWLCLRASCCAVSPSDLH